MPKRKSKDSLLERYYVLFDAAAIGAQARFRTEGFRQKDLRFLIELFSNWIEVSLKGASLHVQNTQIARYLDTLIQEGFARRIAGRAQPIYRLTRVGLMECLARIVRRKHWWPLEEFFFIFSFIESYQARIEGLIKSEGAQFPPLLKLEIQHLLDPSALVETQVRLLDREIEKLDVRIAEGRKASQLAQELIQKGTVLSGVVQEVQRQFPYQLNNQKPLNELFRETPDQDWAWELEVGTSKRVEQIFIPLKELLIRSRDLVRLLESDTRV